MRKSLGVVHCIAECQDCSWRSENYKNGQATAAVHARAHKHRVVVELGLAGEYDGREQALKG